VQTAIAAPQEVDLGDNCDVCQTVVGAIESWLESNETVATIEQYLNQLCSLVPDYTVVVRLQNPSFTFFPKLTLHDFSARLSSNKNFLKSSNGFSKTNHPSKS